MIERTQSRLEGVRCPWCGKFGGAASPGSIVELKCHNCKLVFRRQLPPASEERAQNQQA